jgi:hypothetical protein
MADLINGTAPYLRAMERSDLPATLGFSHSLVLSMNISQIPNTSPQDTGNVLVQQIRFESHQLQTCHLRSASGGLHVLRFSNSAAVNINRSLC